MITLQEIHERDKRPPSVTVYMVCYNHGKYLDEAIQGVFKQKTNFPVHIVIHDDASTDNSQEIIRRYAAENPNITAILEETNFYQNGKSFFPIVLPHLTEKYMAYCECDDFWIDENKLQKQIDYLESNPDCVAVYANIMPVNKYSVRDESARYEMLLGKKSGFSKTGEGDYPLRCFGHKHQISSLVIRNVWRLMTPEEINTYLNAKCTGDYKILALLSHIGRVHYFSEELSAYRRIVDEGDSYTARIAKLSDYDKNKTIVRGISDTYVMIEELFGIRHSFKKYCFALLQELKSRIKYRRSIIKDANFNQCYYLRNIPLYAYAAFPFYFAYKLLRNIAARLFCRE